MEHSSIVRFLEWNFVGPTGQLKANDAKVANLGSWTPHKSVSPFRELVRRGLQLAAYAPFPFFYVCGVAAFWEANGISGESR